ncbi:hypothetical protein NC652_026364 [Populus alba x Populus x berolinensis]|nr:hypothetical protein NC652_026364 [Populus alba x Populus x berolinensis]
MDSYGSGPSAPVDNGTQRHKGGKRMGFGTGLAVGAVAGALACGKGEGIQSFNFVSKFELDMCSDFLYNFLVLPPLFTRALSHMSLYCSTKQERLVPNRSKLVAGSHAALCLHSNECINRCYNGADRNFVVYVKSNVLIMEARKYGYPYFQLMWTKGVQDFDLVEYKYPGKSQ